MGTNVDEFESEITLFTQVNRSQSNQGWEMGLEVRLEGYPDEPDLQAIFLSCQCV